MMAYVWWDAVNLREHTLTLGRCLKTTQGDCSMRPQDNVKSKEDVRWATGLLPQHCTLPR